MRACKFGRSTGYTEGLIDSIGGDYRVKLSPEHDPRIWRFTNQIRIVPSKSRKPFALEGDSGALILELSTNRPVGLFFSGAKDGSYGLANPIQAVTNALGIRLA